MRLSIDLANLEADAPAIASALRLTDIEVIMANSRVVLESETLVPDVVAAVDVALCDCAWRRINELVSVVNGACMVEGHSVRLQLSSVKYLDENGELQFLPVIARGAGYLPALRAHPPDPAVFIATAMRDTAARKALRLYGPDLLWSDMYRIFEVIHADLCERGRDENEWVSDADITRFRRTVNSPIAAGDLSRHGASNEEPPANPMNIKEAQHWLRGLIAHWLRSKN